jgi:hypothetical protein
MLNQEIKDSPESKDTIFAVSATVRLRGRWFNMFQVQRE